MRRLLYTAALAFLAFALFFVLYHPARAQTQGPAWTSDEKPIYDQVRHLRDLADDARAQKTKLLALQIRQLPVTPTKPILANALANLSTEGDFGRDTLQAVATTLATALREKPVPEVGGEPATPYIELAMLVRYEHVQVSLDNPQFAAAMAKLEVDDANRQRADFSLTDLHGKQWHLRELRGKVVLVNFWATWCPPCRKEMPDLEALYERFKARGLVILAMSDEDVATVKSFIAERNVTYPVLLDPGDRVKDLFQVPGIPETFIYDRSGKLAAQSIDMRTQQQFLEMLAQAGLR